MSEQKAIDETKGKKSPTKKKRRSFDSPWKDALAVFFQDFLTFCYPSMAQEIDWDKGHTFLDKELQSITKDAAAGQRTVDKLVKVFKKSEEEVWVLIHTEIQGAQDKNFAERMYTYQYRLFDRYRVPVVSIAVFIDTDKNWAPSVYQSSMWGNELHFKYNVVKLLDYQNQQEMLKESNNPFATIILAQLMAMSLSKERNQEQHLASKLVITKLLYEKGWGKDYVYNLFRFIDWIIQLPKDLVIKYETEILQIEEAKHMTYVTSIERLGIERGKQQGKAEIIQNLYQKLKDEKEVANLSGVSLKKVHEILSKEKEK